MSESLLTKHWRKYTEPAIRHEWIILPSIRIYNENAKGRLPMGLPFLLERGDFTNDRTGLLFSTDWVGFWQKLDDYWVVFWQFFGDYWVVF